MERGRVMGFQADVRAAAMQLLVDYAADAGIKLQAYSGRPRIVAPPTAFVDAIRETIDYSGPTLRRRQPVVEIVVLHGIFDSKEAVDQKDAFVDGLLDWVNTRYHEAGANTLVAITSTEDLPTYVTDWAPRQEDRLLYYATRITMEGLALG